MPQREKNADGTPRCGVNHKSVHRIYREEGLAMRRNRPSGCRPRREYRWSYLT